MSVSRSADYNGLAAVIAATREAGGDHFGKAMVDWLRGHVGFDHCVIFGYRGAARPPLLFETFSPAESHVFVALYQEGPYLLDPFHHAAVERKEGFWRMRELAPDRFYASEYYRSYYSQTKLAEEVGGGALGLALDVSDETAWREVVATATAALGELSVLVNNVASDDRHTLESVTPAYYDERMAINERPAFFAIQS